MRKRLLLVLPIFTIFIFACNTDPASATKTIPTISPLDKLTNNKAGGIVRKAIDYAGGWETWANKKTFSFNKKIESVDSSGTIHRTLIQLHQYQLYPYFKARISWEEKGNQFVIINNGTEAKKYKNGEELTDDAAKNQAWNTSYGSNYVVSMPFKLTDPGVILTYEGIDTLAIGKAVHVLKVEYEKGAGSTGGMHTWWYYFDEKNMDLVANFLDYGEGYSLTTYETFTTVNGIRIHEIRKSYASNVEKEASQLNTIYSNESMAFDKVLDDGLFMLK